MYWFEADEKKAGFVAQTVSNEATLFWETLREQWLLSGGDGKSGWGRTKKLQSFYRERQGFSAGKRKLEDRTSTVSKSITSISHANKDSIGASHSAPSSNTPSKVGSVPSEALPVIHPHYVRVYQAALAVQVQNYLKGQMATILSTSNFNMLAFTAGEALSRLGGGGAQQCMETMLGDLSEDVLSAIAVGALFPLRPREAVRSSPDGRGAKPRRFGTSTKGEASTWKYFMYIH
ncbi:hypothetical protein MMC24_004396 [Lignoscripta atroalba]|nr:hypothetical protein [Lignoscripta atroalba]